MNTLFDLNEVQPVQPVESTIAEPAISEEKRELAEYDRLYALFMAANYCDPVFEESKQALEAMAKKHGKPSALAESFRCYLESRTLRPGDSPAGMNFVHRGKHYRKRGGIWTCDETQSCMHSKTLIALLNYNLTKYLNLLS